MFRNSFSEDFLGWGLSTVIVSGYSDFLTGWQDDGFNFMGFTRIPVLPCILCVYFVWKFKGIKFDLPVEEDWENYHSSPVNPSTSSFPQVKECHEVIHAVLHYTGCHWTLVMCQLCWGGAPSVTVNVNRSTQLGFPIVGMKAQCMSRSTLMNYWGSLTQVFLPWLHGCPLVEWKATSCHKVGSSLATFNKRFKTLLFQDSFPV